MKDYFVAFYINRSSLAGVDDNSGSSYPATFPNSWITSDKKRISNWINTCNYNKTPEHLDYLVLKRIEYSLKTPNVE